MSPNIRRRIISLTVGYPKIKSLKLQNTNTKKFACFCLGVKLGPLCW